MQCLACLPEWERAIDHDAELAGRQEPAQDGHQRALVRWRERATSQLGGHGGAGHQPQHARDAAEPMMPSRTEGVMADQHIATARLQDPAYRGEGVVTGHVEDEVPPFAPPGEVLLDVVDGPVGAQCAQERELVWGIDSGDLRAIGLGELERDGAHAAAGTVDQDSLPCRNPALRRLLSAIRPTVGTAAASSKLIVDGLCASPFSGAVAYSANAPPLRHWRTPRRVSPKTSSLGWNRVTTRPTDSTTPATSVPGTRIVGRRTPDPMRRSAAGWPVTTCHTSGCTDAART